MSALTKEYFEYFIEGIDIKALEGNILHACYYGDIEEISKALSECPEAINAVEKKTGMTPLMIAISHGNYSIVEFLIKRDGLDLSAKNADGLDVYDLAWMSGNRSVLKLIDKQLFPRVNSILEREPKP